MVQLHGSWCKLTLKPVPIVYGRWLWHGLLKCVSCSLLGSGRDANSAISWNFIHNLTCKNPRKLFIHASFFGPWDLHLLVWSELGRSRPFRPMRSYNAMVTGLRSSVRSGQNRPNFSNPYLSNRTWSFARVTHLDICDGPTYDKASGSTYRTWIPWDRRGPFVLIFVFWDLNRPLIGGSISDLAAQPLGLH